MATAAAKSLQSCPTLCDPIDGSSPGSPVLWILQAQTMVEVMKIMATSFKKVPCTHCHTQCPQPCSRPSPTKASTRDSWTVTGKSASVKSSSFFWVLVHSRFCFLGMVLIPASFTISETSIHI